VNLCGLVTLITQCKVNYFVSFMYFHDFRYFRDFYVLDSGLLLSGFVHMLGIFTNFGLVSFGIVTCGMFT